MQVWRICKRIYLDSSFSGDGGLRAPGRWHHRGHRIVYTSQSLSLAQLETWMHVTPQQPLPSYVAVSADIPDDLKAHTVQEAELPADWRAADPSPTALRDIGTRWLLSLFSAVARVPSAVTAGEFNYLLNPLHLDFHRIGPDEPVPFRFDPRIWKQSSTGTI